MTEKRKAGRKSARPLVVVTGASSGIGLATARFLTVEGAEVCLVARRATPLALAADALGDRVWYQSCDVADEAQVEELGLVVEQLNNAAFYRESHQMIFDALIGLYERIMRLPLKGLLKRSKKK